MLIAPNAPLDTRDVTYNSTGFFSPLRALSFDEFSRIFKEHKTHDGRLPKQVMHWDPSAPNKTVLLLHRLLLKVLPVTTLYPQFSAILFHILLFMSIFCTYVIGASDFT